MDFEDFEDNKNFVDYLKSDQFAKKFREQVEKDTWEQGLPMYYMEGNWIIEHWKDGTKNKIREVNMEPKKDQPRKKPYKPKPKKEIGIEKETEFRHLGYPVSIDAEAELTKILTEELGKAVEKEKGMVSDMLKTSDLETAKKMLKIWQSAVDRKLEFDLSFETVKRLLTYKKCYYTGKEFEEDGVFARSFDRIDSGKGYVDGNVVACTVDINGKKSNLTIEEIRCLYEKLIKR
jgi:hypothetical protein